LFDEFVFQLLKREGLAERDALKPAGEVLVEALAELAWILQPRAAAVRDVGSGLGLTLPRSEVVAVLGAEEHLYRAASASVLEDAEPVRFTHQLLQEYFAARRLLVEIARGMPASALWPKDKWQTPTGWEEVCVLAVGMQPDAVLRWVSDVPPEVVVQWIRKSGAKAPPATLEHLRARWVPRLTDTEHDPAPEVRAAVGRALGCLTLEGGAVRQSPRRIGAEGQRDGAVAAGHRLGGGAGRGVHLSGR
jgi:hypothetical protein